MPQKGLRYVLHPDWCKQGLASVLTHIHLDGNERMVACVSRSTNDAERNYPSFEGEMLAVVWGTRTFKQYLWGEPFIILCDHAPMGLLQKHPDLRGKHARYAMLMQEFDYKVVYRPGLDYVLADVPSRAPMTRTEDERGVRWDPRTP